MKRKHLKDSRISYIKDLEVWRWRRPTMQGLNPEINMYDRYILEKIRVCLHQFGNDVFELFWEGPSGAFLQFGWRNNTTRALFDLLTHEVDVEGAENEFWFCVGETNIQFGVPEFTPMIGLQFGDSDVDPTLHPDMPELSCLSDYGGDYPSVEQLHRDFANPSISLSDSMGDYAKIANLLFVYRMLACLDGKRALDAWACDLIEDDDGWRRFTWGSWSYGVLIHQMGRFFTSSEQISARNICHAYGLIWVLQTWFYEAIPELGRICAVQIQPADVIPRCLRKLCPRFGIVRGKLWCGGNRPWWRATQVFCICCVMSRHWVAIRIDLLKWEMKLYDSNMYKLIDDADPVISLMKDRELLPLTRCLPRILDAAGYWRESGRERITDHFTLIKNVADQFCLVDSTSCGTYCMMHVDSLIYAGNPPKVIGDHFIGNHRKWIGGRIHDMCARGRTT